MSKRLASFVHVDGKVYGPGDDVPADVAKAITNPKAWAGKPEPSEAAVAIEEVVSTSDGGGEEPPRSGTGSGVAAWREYALGLGLPVDEGMSREDILVLVDDAK